MVAPPRLKTLLFETLHLFMKGTAGNFSRLEELCGQTTCRQAENETFVFFERQRGLGSKQTPLVQFSEFLFKSVDGCRQRLKVGGICRLILGIVFLLHSVASVLGTVLDYDKL